MTAAAPTAPAAYRPIGESSPVFVLFVLSDFTFFVPSGLRDAIDSLRLTLVLVD